jgi:hypothetical protein
MFKKRRFQMIANSYRWNLWKSTMPLPCLMTIS